jgi:L-ribulose-5-phosphate 3-epimerase
MPFIAVMQGRLVSPEGGHFQSFPRERWRDEFALAAKAGLNAIEWIYDAYGEDANPLATDAGIDEMLSLSEKNGIAIRSVCADYFMDHPFLRTSRENQRQLDAKMVWLLSRCKRAGITRVVIPFVDKSQIENDGEAEEAVTILQTLLISAESIGIELHIESSLVPDSFARLLKQCESPFIRVNYDSGNSASLGYQVKSEFAAYGNRIGSVHIKDRKLGSATVPLGTGDADLPSVFRCLAALNYLGDYVLQIARSESGDEVNWIARNRVWVAAQIEDATQGIE